MEADSFLKGLLDETLIIRGITTIPKCSNWFFIAVLYLIAGPPLLPAIKPILFEKDHGLEGFVNVAGIESPGLTSSLSLAKYVAGGL